MTDPELTPTPAPTPAPTSASTLIDAAPAPDPAPTPAAGDPPAPAPAPAPSPATADWRTKLAGEDKDLAKVLARYTDEAAFGKAHKSLLARMSSGELKKSLPDNASAEEIATWRKENGIPENETGYVEKLELPDGLVLGEADKPIVSEFAKAALAGNVDPKQFNGLVAKYYEIQEQQKAAQAETDATFRQASEDALRQAWQGPEFRQNLTAIQNMMAGWPEGLATRVLAGRTPDGRKLGDDPAFVQQMAALARELNPAASLVPAGTTNAGKSLADELEGIRNMRRTEPEKYEANRKQLEAREIEIIDVQRKLSQQRNAA